MTREEFLHSLDARINERPLLEHPFYRMWTEGTLPVPALRAYSAQYWHLVWAFPTCLSALHARTQDPKIRREIVRNLAEEEGGDQTHPELWLRFAEGIGASRAEVGVTPPLPETRGLVETMRYLSERGSWFEAVASFYAHESQVPDVAAAKIEGMRKHFPVTDPKALAYFEVHEEMDREHSAAWRGLLAEGCKDEYMQFAALDAAGRTADGLWHLLDGIYDAYVAPRVPAAAV
jgi:pyrroloquinoline-quinone synthase